ncbi:hypothetical protein DXG01_011952 [Tephrocybe rancida]|nr:hypothetical protein DXG01_011952 [Tephrocybe rancida]
MNQQNTHSSSRPPRKRTVSLSSLSSISSGITLEFPKADVATVTVHTRSHSVYGSFTPTPPARPGLDHLKRASVRSNLFPIGRPGRLQIFTHHASAEEESDSPLSSGSTSPSLPSFSRTASPPLVPSSTLTSSSILDSPVRRTGEEVEASDEESLLRYL